MELFTLDPGLAIWTWISFGLLFLLLARFLFPALQKAIRTREKAIADSLDKAAWIEGRLASLEAERQEVLHQARREADQILRQTRAQAEELAGHLRNKAETEAQALLQTARTQALAEQGRIRQELNEQLALLICQGTEALTGRLISGEEEKAWTRQMVARL